MSFSVICDESNNDYGAELRGEIIADIRFAGSSKVYEVTFVPVEGRSFPEIRSNLFQGLVRLLGTFSDEEVGEMLFSQSIKSGGY